MLSSNPNQYIENVLYARDVLFTEGAVPIPFDKVGIE
jgi:hypothetical protein